MDQTLPKLLRRISNEHPDVSAQYTRTETGDFSPLSYRDCYSAVLDFAAALVVLGHARADHIGLIADNRKEWLHSSMAIMAIGCADVPRGCDANAQEVTYILSFSECRTVILESDVQAAMILENREQLPLLNTIIFMDAPQQSVVEALTSKDFKVFSYAAILKMGKTYRETHAGEIEAELEKGSANELATIIFTSGTTGEPKGVMLTHDNFLCQLEELVVRIDVHPGNRALCVLPVWHSFERTCEYVIISGGAGIVYSKPIGSVLLADFAAMNPQLLPSVPRIWESVYDGIVRAMRKTGGVTWILFSFFVSVAILHARFTRMVFARSALFSPVQHIVDLILGIIPFILLYPLKSLGDILIFRKIRAKLGNAFNGGVSGGGALPPNVDAFFWAVGVNVVEGYGLTETAPVVAVRPFAKPIFGTIGTPLSCCTVKIVDDQGVELPAGKKGTVLVRGRNVMQGYYRKPDLTKNVLSHDGWLNTGDLGLKTIHGEIILRGRKKDTIVLRGGENIEPLPLEMKINESRFISQSVVMGQDQRYLGALIVVNKEELEAWALENQITYTLFTELLKDAQAQKLYETEIAELICAKTGFKLYERINKFVLLEKPFELGVELSAKQEIKRYMLPEIYKKEVHQLFS